ncbi:MAG TPA: class D sortase [Candidatus Micrarchaeia archaeon]|nr:class D sortase [Candidatus Micrarchaeia archaeon]
MTTAHGVPGRHARRDFLLLRWVSFVFLLAGVVAVAYASFVVLYGEAFQAIELHKFEHVAPAAEPHLLNIGEIIGEIQIPKLGVKAIVVEGDTPEVLDRGVGHLPQTPLPGQWGNVALAAHRDRLFRPLREIHQGDTIIITTPNGALQYEVHSTFVVPATEVGVLRSSDAKELTLITCFPFNYIGHAPNRFVVRAREVMPAHKWFGP